MGILYSETSASVKINGSGGSDGPNGGECKGGPNPDLVPVRMELKGIVNGTKIPESVWRPLFGGEELTRELWDKLIPKVGDEVIVKGSSGARKLFSLCNK